MMKKAKDVQHEVVENAHKVWLAGLGAFAVAEEEGAKFLKNLMEKGEDIESKGKEHLDKAKGAATRKPRDSMPTRTSGSWGATASARRSTVACQPAG